MGARFILSRDGYLQKVMQEEYTLCRVLDSFFIDTTSVHACLPFLRDELEDFVFALRATASNITVYPAFLDQWDSERRARLLTIANYVHCPHLISMCAWRDAKELYKQDKRTCEQYKKWRILAWLGL